MVASTPLHGWLLSVAKLEEVLMRFGSKTLAATLAAAVALTGALATSNAQEMKFWRIGTGGAGGTYFPIGGLSLIHI